MKSKRKFWQIDGLEVTLSMSGEPELVGKLFERLDAAIVKEIVKLAPKGKKKGCGCDDKSKQGG